MVVLVMLVGYCVGGSKLAVRWYAIVFIAFQPTALISAVSMFFVDYNCGLTKKVAYAAYVLTVASVLIWIGIYLLDALDTDKIEPLYILIGLSFVALFDTGLSFIAKRMLLNVPIPWTTKKLG